jgi:hypothetical protein
MPYVPHPTFTPPPPASTIWRYMSFTKFMAMLDKQALYFARGDVLAAADPYEGIHTHVNAAPLAWEMAPSDFLASRGFKSQEDLDRFNKLKRKTRDMTAHMRQFFFINCWYLGEDESDAMWKLYCGTHDGICVRSTFGLLVDSIKAVEEPVYIGKVRYIDYRREAIKEGDAFAPLVHKRRSFQHENEIRALVWRLEESEGAFFDAEGRPATKDNYSESRFVPKYPERMGVSIPVDIQMLVQAVYVSPTSANWFRELVVSAIAKWGGAMRVEQSILSDAPPK